MNWGLLSFVHEVTNISNYKIRTLPIYRTVLAMIVCFCTAYRQVLTEIVSTAKEWRDLGTSLDLSYHVLDEIEADHIRDGVRRCLEGVIHCWLEGNGSKVSWSVLCEALRCELVGRPNLAADIEFKYVLCMD